MQMRPMSWSRQRRCPPMRSTPRQHLKGAVVLRSRAGILCVPDLGAPLQSHNYTLTPVALDPLVTSRHLPSARSRAVAAHRVRAGRWR